LTQFGEIVLGANVGIVLGDLLEILGRCTEDGDVPFFCQLPQTLWSLERGALV
jgi:hypothetical protein